MAFSKLSSEFNKKLLISGTIGDITLSIGGFLVKSIVLKRLGSNETFETSWKNTR